MYCNCLCVRIKKKKKKKKNLRLLGDCNLCLQRIETCHYSHEFLFASQSCYHIPTINKPKPVHRASVSLINNIFVNNPDQVLVNGNLITDVSDHVSQFCIVGSTKHRIKHRQIKKHDFSHFCSNTLLLNFLFLVMN